MTWETSRPKPQISPRNGNRLACRSKGTTYNLIVLGKQAFSSSIEAIVELSKFPEKHNHVGESLRDSQIPASQRNAAKWEGKKRCLGTRICIATRKSVRTQGFPRFGDRPPAMTKSLPGTPKLPAARQAITTLPERFHTWSS